MVKRNLHFSKLSSGYLFQEINKRKKQLLTKQPNIKLISLGVGDTTLPLDKHVAGQIEQFASKLSTKEGYSGYGPEQGQAELREKIANTLYQGKVQADEIFVSDGAKCDIGRLQVLFGSQATMAVQDPAYPVYVDTGVMLGQTETFDVNRHCYPGIQYMPCLPSNDFFPDLKKLPRTDLIYFCSPNNPTGAVASRAQLEQLVAFAKKNRSIIIFDAAYFTFIQDPRIPKSIFEIEGAREVALEVNSFSKMAGFTGLRLGWTVVPTELKFEDGTQVRKDWERIHTTFFNGASNIVQKGGLATLEPEGLKAVKKMSAIYMENTRLIRKSLSNMGITTYGGENAPYVWADFSPRKSWEVFEEILETAHVVTTPGSGFGAAGEGFLRLSGFAPRVDIEEGLNRIQKALSME